jgi:hypothetical protein
MRRGGLVAVALGLTLAALASADASAHAHITCRSGRTVFRRPGVRVFVTVRVFGNPRQEGARYKAHYVCRKGSRKPLLFDPGQPFTTETVSQYKLVGDRLGFVTSSAGVQSGGQATVGWVDLKLGAVKEAVINASEGLTGEQEEEPGLPTVPSDELDYAIAGDGAIALIGEGGEPLEWQVCVLAVKRHALGPPKVLFKTASQQEALDLHSISITAATVSWTSKSGRKFSVPR